MAKAVVFGAAGVTGWGLCRALLEYPTRHSFSSVIGLTLHPVSKDEDYFTDDDRLSTHTGIDLTVSEQEVQQQLSQIPGFADATHVYYVGTAKITLSNIAQKILTYPQHAGYLQLTTLRKLRRLICACFKPPCK
jgi:hypothetical protein